MNRKREREGDRNSKGNRKSRSDRKGETGKKKLLLEEEIDNYKRRRQKGKNSK